MGLFSLFRKGKPAVDDDDAYARLAAGSELRHEDDAALRDGGQRDSARAIVLKIDAIEAAMAADMFDEPAFRRPPRQAAQAVAMPSEGPVTEWLEEDDMPAGAPTAEAAPAVEEAAILYANGQADEACRLLAEAVAQRPAADRTAWWMLFDLYQLLGRQEAFDSLAIDYASAFETSPPPWDAAWSDAGDYSGVIPTAAPIGMLDAAAAAQAARAVAVAEGGAMARLDFSRIAGIEPEGCALLCDILRRAQQGHELILAGLGELLALLRASVDVGRREDGQAPWLLLLELLRLSKRAKAFRETAMDYGLTFGVPPPPFTPPGKVVIAPREALPPVAQRFLLPRVIEGDATDVLSGIVAYAEHCHAPVFDCARLARIDYAAAARLLALLRPLAGPACRIELRDVNHPVTALLGLLGYAEAVRLVARRY